MRFEAPDVLPESCGACFCEIPGVHPGEGERMLMRKILIAGGLCGTTMLMAGEKLTQRCLREGVELRVTIQNLWETTYVAGTYDLIIEMFPYFQEEACPVMSGKPFISHVGEKELIEKIAAILCGQDTGQ